MQRASMPDFGRIHATEQGTLIAAGVLLKDFLPFAEKLTQQLRHGTEELAQAAGRPVR